MPVTPVGSTSAGVSSAGGNITFDVSGLGLADGDLLLFFVGNDAGTANTLTPPGTVSLVRDDNDAGSFGERVRVYDRIWHTGDATSYAFNLAAGAAGCGICLALRGADSATPVDVSTGNVNGTAGTNCPTTSATPGYSDEFLVVLNWGDNSGANTAVTITLNAALTPQIQNVRPPTDTPCVMSVGTQQLSGSGVTGTKNGTFSGAMAFSIGQLIVVKPVPSPYVPLLNRSKRMKTGVRSLA